MADNATKSKSCCGLKSVVDDEKPERQLGTGQGTKDTGQGEMGERGSRQAQSGSDWRLAIGEWLRRQRNDEVSVGACL